MTFRSCGSKSDAFSGLTVKSSFISRGRAVFAEIDACRVSATCLTVPDKVINAVIGPPGTATPAGSTLYATVQDAVTAAGQWDLGSVLLQLPAGNFAEDILLDNASSQSVLIIRGEAEPQFGLGYQQGNPNDPLAGNHVANYPVELGSGIMTLVAAGATITVTGSVLNPTLDQLNILAGDTILIYDDLGSVSTNTIQSITAPNILNLAAAAPAIASLGAGFAFVPRTQLSSVSGGVRTGYTALQDLYVSGQGVVATDPGGNIPRNGSAGLVQAGNGLLDIFNSVLYNTDLLTGSGLLLTPGAQEYSQVALSTVVANRAISTIIGQLFLNDILIWVPNSASQRGYGLGISWLGEVAGVNVNIAALANADLVLEESTGSSVFWFLNGTLLTGTLALATFSNVLRVRSGHLIVSEGLLLYNDALAAVTDAVTRVTGGELTFDVIGDSGTTSIQLANILGTHIINDGGLVAIKGSPGGATFASTEGSAIVRTNKVGNTVVDIFAGTYAVAVRGGGGGDEVAVGNNAADGGSAQGDRSNLTDTRLTARGKANYLGIDIT